MTSTSHGRLRTIPVVCDSNWPDSISCAVAGVARRLGACLPGDKVAVVVEVPPDDSAHAGALREAMRSLVHASVLERPTVRVNLVFGGSRRDREVALAYLSTADFVLGATLDLRQIA